MMAMFVAKKRNTRFIVLRLRGENSDVEMTLIYNKRSLMFFGIEQESKVNSKNFKAATRTIMVD